MNKEIIMSELRCKCGFNYRKINNLYYCKNCDKYTTSFNSLPIYPTDLRRYVLLNPKTTRAIGLSQLDLLKLSSNSGMVGSHYYLDLLVNYIKKVDKDLNETTLFNRRLPRVRLKDELGF